MIDTLQQFQSIQLYSYFPWLLPQENDTKSHAYALKISIRVLFIEVTRESKEATLMAMTRFCNFPKCVTFSSIHDLLN